MVAATKSRGGRPPMGPKSGKGSVLATRITAETRAALEREAERTGRSISQVAELWLEEARTGRADYLARLGGSAHVAAGFEKMIDVMETIDERLSDPVERHLATTAAWEFLAQFAAPWPSSDYLTNLSAETDRIWEACAAVLSAVEAAGPQDPAYQAAMAPLVSDEWSGLLGNKVLVDKLAAALDPRSKKSAELAARGLLALHDAAAKGSPKELRDVIAAAVGEASRHLDKSSKGEARKRQARELGEEIARAAVFGQGQ